MHGHLSYLCKLVCNVMSPRWPYEISFLLAISDVIRAICSGSDAGIIASKRDRLERASSSTRPRIAASIRVFTLFAMFLLAWLRVL